MDLSTAALITVIALTTRIFSVAALNFAKAALVLAKAYRLIKGSKHTKRTRTARK